MNHRAWLRDPLSALRGRTGWNRLWLLLALMCLLDLLASIGLTTRLAELHDEVLQLHALREGGRAAKATVLVVIDDQEYRQRYGQKSPLDPVAVAQTLEQIALAQPRALVVDLDLSPLDEADALLRRTQTDRALASLAARLPVLVACPQSASMSKGLTMAESLWVSALHAQGVGVARADMDDRGLYAATAPDAIVPALARRLNGQAAGPETNAPCLPGHETAGHRRVLHPWNVVQVRAQDLSNEAARALLKGRVVVFGGTYGPSDTFQLRGAPLPIHGATLHAWQIETELHRERWPHVPEGAAFIARLGFAWLYATVLAWAWRQVADPDLSAPGRWLAYLLTIAFVVAGPVLTLSLSWKLPDLGQTLGLSAVFVGILFSAVIAAPLLVDARTRATAATAATDSKNYRDLSRPDHSALSLHRWIDVPWGGDRRQAFDQITLVGTRWLLVVAAATEVFLHAGAVPAVAMTAGLLLAGARQASEA